MDAEEFEALLLDCLKQARHQGVPSRWTSHGSALNQLCGDVVDIYLDVEAGTINHATAVCKGCSVSQASGVLTSRILEGLAIDECSELAEEAQLLVHTGIYKIGEISEYWKQSDWELFRELLIHMHRFPLRYNCVLLPWKAVHCAISHV